MYQNIVKEILRDSGITYEDWNACGYTTAIEEEDYIEFRLGKYNGVYDYFIAQIPFFSDFMEGD